jgi:hypothetical protein
MPPKKKQSDLTKKIILTKCVHTAGHSFLIAMKSMVSRRLKCTGKQILHKQLQLEKLLKRQYDKISLGHISKSNIFLKKEKLGLLLYDTLFSIEADILKLSNKRTSCHIDISKDCYISIVVRTKQQILPDNILW